MARRLKRYGGGGAGANVGTPAAGSSSRTSLGQSAIA
jgi:hypothetical protein